MRPEGIQIDPHGYDAGKKIKGKKRRIRVDTQGLAREAIVHGAGVQDRDGGALLMTSLFGLSPFLLKLYAGYQGPEFQRALNKTLARVRSEIIKRSEKAKAFVVLPKRWIVDRTWLGRCRRLAKDFGNRNRKARAFLRLASIPLMLESFVIQYEVSGQTLKAEPPTFLAHRAGSNQFQSDCREIFEIATQPPRS